MAKNNQGSWLDPNGKSMMIVFIGVLVAFIFLVAAISLFMKDNPEKEELSYSFGFPTSGSYNYGGGPLKGSWPGLIRYPGWNTSYNPFMWPYYSTWYPSRRLYPYRRWRRRWRW